MKNFIPLVYLLVLFFLAQIVIGQQYNSSFLDNSFLEKLRNADRNEFKYIPKKPGHYTKQDWRSVIDSTWGQGMTPASKLQLFNYCCNFINAKYPSFFHIQDNWDSLRNVYKSEVADSNISRGRFAAIMSRMFSSLTDRHSFVADVPVARDTLKPGIPLFVPMGVNSMYPRMFHMGDYCHFGASLAPLPDSSVFVYNVVENHPLGLKRGDIILGYDNIPWKQLYKELLAAELPIAGFGSFGSNPTSVIHGLLTAAGENWHLFDIIDILKYSTGDTVHLPTSLLINQQMQLLSSEQLPVPGVSFPDIDNGHHVSWGIVDGTQTGYIYTWSWMRKVDYPPPSYNAGDEFLLALQSLINDYQIDGLIIDSRFNNGGFTYQYMQCLSVLFNEDQYTFSEFIRNDANDHYSLKRSGRDITGFTASHYLFDRPIAVLTGPYSVSCGDFMPLQMREHPMVRTFGLGTNGAYGATVLQTLSPVFSSWDFATSYSNFTMANDPNTFLTHLNISPDEEIWFTQEDAVNGDDNVVKRALEWINNVAYSYSVAVKNTFFNPWSSSHLETKVKNPNNDSISILAYIASTDSSIIDSVYLSNQYLKGDSLWGTGIQGYGYEKFYNVGIKTLNLKDSSSFSIPIATRFTTAGPLVIDTFVVSHPNDSLVNIADLTLSNLGHTKEITAVAAKFVCIDSSVSRILTSRITFGKIPPGESRKGTFSLAYISKRSSSSNKFELEISSADIVYWKDTLTINTPPVDVKTEPQLPTEYSLAQNYPNPFNPITTIKYQLPSNVKSEKANGFIPSGVEGDLIQLKVYDILGREATTLVNQKQKPGNYEVRWDAKSQPSGVYFYQLSAGDFIETKKMILLK